MYSKRTLMIGVGFAGKLIIDELINSPIGYTPICALDDKQELQNTNYCNVPIVGTLQNISSAVKKYDIETIIFAIPSMPEKERAEVLKECTNTGVEVKVIPLITDLIRDISFVKQIRNPEIDELLPREPISFDEKSISEYINGKIVLITGGGGSIGSELCRQIAKFNPQRIVIVDIYENGAYDIEQEIKNNCNRQVDIQVEIASITEYNRLESVFKRHNPNIVFHAAAHKHVPLMENNPGEAVKNNVFGTINVIKISKEYFVDKFILISSDKAVNPTNVMGATKRCCEKIVQIMSKLEGKTKFSAVRFGNVLGSNGSVVPLFKKQILKGGPVTVTHKDIIRYFMTIPEAVSLVLQASVYAQNGEIFVLDMGEQIKIVTLAENLIKAMGFVPYKDINIIFTGLRPGEKLYEELLMNEEGLARTANKKIFIGKQVDFDIQEFIDNLNDMRVICEGDDRKAILTKLKELVPTYIVPKEI